MQSRFLAYSKIMGTALFTTMLYALIILNVLSGIVAGVWLAVLGEWGSLFYGILFSIAMPWAFTIVDLPGLGLGVLTAYLSEKGKKIPTILVGFLAFSYTSAIIAAWTIFNFTFFLLRSGGSNVFVHLMWAYSTTLAPLSYMSSREDPDSIGTALGLFLAQVSTVVLCITYYLGGSLLQSIYIIVGLLSIESLFIAYLSYMISASESPIDSWEHET